MHWLEQKIRRYEHMRWSQEPNRRVLPFAWGLEHIGGDAKDPNPRAFLDHFVNRMLEHSEEWFAVTPADDYDLRNGVLTFTSGITSPWAENNRVYGQFSRARCAGPAVVVLAQWNARWEEQRDTCGWLNRLGMTAIKMSLPYHDRRAIRGHPRGDHLVGPNIGLTLQANRQAVVDVRRTLLWLEREGYGPLGIVGTSVGSCIAFVTMCHEPLLRAGAFLHVSSYFGDVVANGLTTINVWESLEQKVSAEELQRFWAPISPFPYVSKLERSGKKILTISARYDPTFWPAFTAAFLGELSRDGLRAQSLSLPCGHYSLGVAPFKYAVGFRFGTFLLQSLG
jgi:Alpha/beta hydrolase domain containing 18